jgi:hypothetical protein
VAIASVQVVFSSHNIERLAPHEVLRAPPTQWCGVIGAAVQDNYLGLTS